MIDAVSKKLDFLHILTHKSYSKQFYEIISTFIYCLLFSFYWKHSAIFSRILIFFQSSSKSWSMYRHHNRIFYIILYNIVDPANAILTTNMFCASMRWKITTTIIFDIVMQTIGPRTGSGVKKNLSKKRTIYLYFNNYFGVFISYIHNTLFMLYNLFYTISASKQYCLFFG